MAPARVPDADAMAVDVQQPAASAHQQQQQHQQQHQQQQQQEPAVRYASVDDFSGRVEIYRGRHSVVWNVACRATRRPLILKGYVKVCSCACSCV